VFVASHPTDASSTLHCTKDFLRRAQSQAAHRRPRMPYRLLTAAGGSGGGGAARRRRCARCVLQHADRIAMVVASATPGSYSEVEIPPPIGPSSKRRFVVDLPANQLGPGWRKRA
jgi:hypothetical protein